MKSGGIKKYLKIGVKLKLFEKLKFEKWSLENYLKIRVLKIKFKNWNLKKKNGNGNFGKWKF